MSRWIEKVTATPDDYTPVLEAYEHFTNQYEEARAFLNVDGLSINEVSKRLPGEMEYRFGQLQEVEAIVRYLEIREQRVQGEMRRHYTEHYNKALTERQVERYAESHADVISIMELRNTVALVRNRFLGLTKGYEMLHFQVGNIVRLRAAGLDEAVI